MDDFLDLEKEDFNYIIFSFHKVWQEKDTNIQSNIKPIITIFKDKGFKVNTSGFAILENTCYADKINSSTINYNGDVFKCTARDFTEYNREGELTEKGEIIWNEKYKKRFDKKYTNKSCFNCSVFPICKGGCSQIYFENKKDDYCIYNYDKKKKDNVILELFLNKIQTKIL